MSPSEHWVKAAYRGSGWLKLLRPLAALYRYAMARREAAYRRGDKNQWRAPVPVLVVGNITLGGTGKSPLVAWLARWLVARGYRPGIVSRGYGGKSPSYPLDVHADTPVAHSGDEPLMLAQQTGVAVVADPQRARGAQRLVALGCDIILSDDGLQHLALARDIELVVVDGSRGLGNGECLPAGPLREPAERLQRVDKVIVNGGCEAASFGEVLAVDFTAMTLKPTAWRRLDGLRAPLEPLPFEQPVHGLAGIGNPQRFFKTLTSLGVKGDWHALGDHHRFRAEDFAFGDERSIVITAKDAVKCRELAPSNTWILEVEADLPPHFEDWLATRLLEIT
ncbi:tetraacyldisaccharide 4'-kinase [Halomonas sp. Bachu 37]|uniref:tetraacyldisaccharide 4'-kinase n=1 Tax=Halomonas kashgarensis TaxID=3084920 RepID=UPI003217062B